LAPHSRHGAGTSQHLKARLCTCQPRSPVRAPTNTQASLRLKDIPILGTEELCNAASWSSEFEVISAPNLSLSPLCAGEDFYFFLSFFLSFSLSFTFIASGIHFLIGLWCMRQHDVFFKSRREGEGWQALFGVDVGVGARNGFGENEDERRGRVYTCYKCCAQHHLLLVDKRLIFFISRLLKSIYLLSRTKNNQLVVRRVIGRFHYISLNPTSRARKRIFRRRYTLLRILRMALSAGMTRMILCTQGIIQVSKFLCPCILKIL
jgi:hypothetical protein